MVHCLVEDTGVEPMTLPCHGSVFPTIPIPQIKLVRAERDLYDWPCSNRKQHRLDILRRELSPRQSVHRPQSQDPLWSQTCLTFWHVPLPTPDWQILVHLFYTYNNYTFFSSQQQQ